MSKRLNDRWILPALLVQNFQDPYAADDIECISNETSDLLSQQQASYYYDLPPQESQQTHVTTLPQEFPQSLHAGARTPPVYQEHAAVRMQYPSAGLLQPHLPATLFQPHASGPTADLTSAFGQTVAPLPFAGPMYGQRPAPPLHQHAYWPAVAPVTPQQPVPALAGLAGWPLPGFDPSVAGVPQSLGGPQGMPSIANVLFPC